MRPSVVFLLWSQPLLVALTSFQVCCMLLFWLCSCLLTKFLCCNSETDALTMQNVSSSLSYMVSRYIILSILEVYCYCRLHCHGLKFFFLMLYAYDCMHILYSYSMFHFPISLGHSPVKNPEFLMDI